MLSLMNIPSLSRQTPQRLAESKLNNVAIRITHHRKITNHAAEVHRLLDQDVLPARKLSDAIDFFARVALKAKMVEARLYFLLYDHQNEGWIFAGFGSRPQPDIVPPFNSAIADDRQTAEGSVEVD
jgi:hypothetical protein